MKSKWERCVWLLEVLLWGDRGHILHPSFPVWNGPMIAGASATILGSWGNLGLGRAGWKTTEQCVRAWDSNAYSVTPAWTTARLTDVSHLSTIYSESSYYLQPTLASLVAQMVKNLPTMWETQVQSLGQEDSLEKGMATHSTMLAWRILWTEEPGGLRSMGSQRVGHEWATKHSSAYLFLCDLSMSLPVYLFYLNF